jgi:hypothetical protein
MAQHQIGEIFGRLGCCGLKLAEFHLDLDIALFDFGFAVSFRQEWRSSKIDLGGSAAIAVVGRLGGPLDHRDTVVLGR